MKVLILIIFVSLGICAVSFSTNAAQQKHNKWAKKGDGFTQAREKALQNALSSIPIHGGRHSLCMAALPQITLKIAMDKNGAVDDLSDDRSKRFTSPEALDAVHRLRAEMDAVMVGVGTVLRDNPSLTVSRVPYSKKTQPLRIVLDGKLSIPGPEYGVNVLTDGNPTVVFFTEMGPMGWVIPDGWPEKVNPSRYWRAGSHMLGLLGNPVSFKKLPIDESISLMKEQFTLTSMLEELEKLGNFEQILLEGGPTVAKQFLSQSLVTRAIIVKAPIEFSGSPIPSNIDESVLTSAGLQLLGKTHWGTDTVEMWSKPDIAWPKENIHAWP